MITLPPGFDFASLIGDYYAAVLPFITVAVLVVSAVFIKRAIGGVH